MSYKAPVKDLLFNIEHLARIDQIAAIPGFEDAGLETAQAVLEECARFNEGVVAPLNFEADKAPSSHSGITHKRAPSTPRVAAICSLISWVIGATRAERR